MGVSSSMGQKEVEDQHMHLQPYDNLNAPSVASQNQIMIYIKQRLVEKNQRARFFHCRTGQIKSAQRESKEESLEGSKEAGKERKKIDQRTAKKTVKDLCCEDVYG